MTSFLTCQLDNHGNHTLLTDESPINVPGIAAAHVVKRYTAQAVDELSLEVSWRPQKESDIPWKVTSKQWDVWVEKGIEGCKYSILKMKDEIGKPDPLADPQSRFLQVNSNSIDHFIMLPMIIIINFLCAFNWSRLASLLSGNSAVLKDVLKARLGDCRIFPPEYIWWSDTLQLVFGGLAVELWDPSSVQNTCLSLWPGSTASSLYFSGRASVCEFRRSVVQNIVGALSYFSLSYTCARRIASSFNLFFSFRMTS